MVSGSDNVHRRPSVVEAITSLNFKHELVYGSLAGFTICLIGHPFDTLKTYVQISGQRPMKAIRTILSHGGVTNFYKGMLSPLGTTTLLNAIVFASYEGSRKVISQSWGVSIESYKVIGIAGFLTGVINSFVCGPMELMKVKKQTTVDNSSLQSYVSILRNIRRVSGIRGVFQGTYLTMGRDSMCYSGQFMSYHMILDLLSGRQNGSSDVKWHHFAAGAVAGLAAWVPSYPIDTVKSVYQGENITKKLSVLPSGKAMEITRRIFQNSGVRGFFAGLLSIMGRAVFANAAGFFVWNYSKSIIKLE